MFIQRLKQLPIRAFRSNIMRDSSALMVSSVASTGMGLATSVVLARRLGAENYGLIILAIAVVSTIVNFLDIRTGKGLIKFMGSALARGDQREAITFFYVGLSADFALMVVTMAVVAIAAPAAADAYKKGEILVGLASVYLLTVPFTTLQSSFGAVLTVFKRFRLRAIVSIISSLTLLVALLMLSERGVAATMWGYVIAAGVTFGLWVGLGSMLLLRNFETFRGENYWRAWRQFLPFAFHTSIIASLKAIGGNSAVLILGALLTPTDISFYRIARSAATLISLPISPVRAVMYPIMVEEWARNNLKRIRQIIGRYMLYSSALSLGGVLILFVAADWLVQIFYGVEFAPVANLLRILAVGTSIAVIFSWTRQAAFAGGKPHLVTISGMLQFVTGIFITTALVFGYGVVGAAIGQVARVLISLVIRGVLLIPNLGLWNNFVKERRKAESSGQVTHRLHHE